MSRAPRLGLACLTLFLVLFPLTLPKPGLPAGLKADEPAYYLMALSLARDGDLRLAVEDVDRLFREFPFRPADNVIVMSDDGWRTIYYGKPYVYSLSAAPFARLFGANGLLSWNMVLLAAMVWMGFIYLRRYNSEGLAALFAAAFSLASLGFAYAFWLHPEVFNMASVAAAAFFAFHRPEGGGGEGGRRWPWRAALSGACLMPAVYNKPMIALLALPLLFAPIVGRRWREAAAWGAGAAAAMGLVVGLAVALTGHATPYLGVVRQGVTLCQPGVLPIGPAAGEGEGVAGAGEDRPTGGAWSWIFQVPTIDAAELLENAGYFLWGRHTGLFLYMPFAVVAVLLFLLRNRRSGGAWTLLGSLAAIAGVFLVLVSHNWQGGGGFIGNRYFVNLYPAFLFLVTELRPRWPLAAGSAAAGLFLAPILLSPFGRSQPEPTLQSHTRSRPFQLFPLELSLREVPGYLTLPWGDRTVIGRKDLLLPRGEMLWLRGASRAELWLLGGEPLDAAVFLVRSPAPDNRIRLRMEGAEVEVETAAGGESGAWRRVVLEPEGGPRWVFRPGGETPAYRLVVTPETGRVRHWTRRMPPASCPYFAHNDSWEESFFLGAAVLYLGPAAALEEEVFGVRWGRIDPPAAVAAAEAFTLPVRLFNTSGATWRRSGAARVRLSYRWRPAAGGTEPQEGRRTDLPLPVAPGERVVVRLEIEAPATPGRYALEIDPVFEHVAWFSERGVPVYRTPVEVVPPAPEEGAAAAQRAAPTAGRDEP